MVVDVFDDKWLLNCLMANGCGCVWLQMVVDVFDDKWLLNCLMANGCGSVRWQMVVDVPDGKWLWVCFRAWHPIKQRTKTEVGFVLWQCKLLS